MELNHLRYFYTVAREGGFTRAARVLRVQQPAISKIVRQLEQSLDVLLLERDKRQVRLTAAGEDVYRQCVEIFARVDNIAHVTERDRRVCHGPLRLGASDVVAAHGSFIGSRDIDYAKDLPIGGKVALTASGCRY